jgi:hypothetical protein
MSTVLGLHSTGMKIVDSIIQLTFNAVPGS